MGALPIPQFLSGDRIAIKRSASPLTTGTLWTYTGGILIKRILGIVRTGVQAQATTVRLAVKNDALAAFNLDAGTLDLDAAAIGSVISLPAAVGSALVLTVAGALKGLFVDDVPIETICTTSGIITATYGAASTGVIDWYLRWAPVVPGSRIS